MIDFPISDLLDSDLSLAWLERHLHSEGLHCPHCGSGQRRIARQNKHYPSYRCLDCDGYYSLFTDTIFEKTRQSPSTLVLLLRGIAQGETTNRLSRGRANVRELSMSYQQVLTLRQRIQQNLYEKLPTTILENEREVEVDELFQNAGEKRYPSHRPTRPATTASKQASRARHL
jgi:transposase-like protein